MPPHCDSMDGPVVTAGRKALEVGDVALALAFVPREGEAEVAAAFDRARLVRIEAPAAKEVGDLYFFETLVRVHRAGEGAPYTGLKPAGLDVGPVIPLAERSIETGSGTELSSFLCRVVAREVEDRLARVLELRTHADGNLDANRAYVEAMLGLQVWTHQVYLAAIAEAHGEPQGEGHHHG